MRKAFLHERVLLDPIESELLRRGFRASREYAVTINRQIVGFIDLYAVQGVHRVACEAELTPRRAANDVMKGSAVGASLLLIITPTGRIAARIDEDLRRAGYGCELRVCVLPLGRALGLIRDCFPLIPDAFRDPESSRESQP